MKPTAQQTAVLALIELGHRDVSPTSVDRDIDHDLTVASFQWSRDGHAILAHRTVLVDEPVGNPRLDYRTEIYRIQRDGSVARL